MLCFFLNFCLICLIFFYLQLHNFPFIFLLSFFFFQISPFFLFPLYIYPEMTSTNSPPTRGGLVGAGGEFSNIYTPYREVYICDMEIVHIWFLWPMFRPLQEKVFGNFLPPWGTENLWTYLNFYKSWVFKISFFRLLIYLCWKLLFVW
jgi:hypothetical protein